MSKKTTATKQPANAAEPTVTASDEPVTVKRVADPSCIAPAAKTVGGSGMVVGEHYSITRQMASGENPQHYLVVVESLGEKTVDVKFLNQGNYSNVQTIEKAGLKAKNVSNQVAYNLSIDPAHYGG